MPETNHPANCPANCDVVLELEDAGVGVEEILQYARGALDNGEIRVLIDGLRALVAGAGTADELDADPDNDPGDDGDDDGGGDDDFDGDFSGKRDLETLARRREVALV